MTSHPGTASSTSADSSASMPDPKAAPARRVGSRRRPARSARAAPLLAHLPPGRRSRAGSASRPHPWMGSGSVALRGLLPGTGTFVTAARYGPGRHGERHRRRPPEGVSSGERSTALVSDASSSAAHCIGRSTRRYWIYSHRRGSHVKASFVGSESGSRPRSDLLEGRRARRLDRRRGVRRGGGSADAVRRRLRAPAGAR